MPGLALGICGGVLMPTLGSAQVAQCLSHMNYARSLTLVRQTWVMYNFLIRALLLVLSSE